MKQNIELLNIEVGTFKRVGQKLSIKIDRNQFRYDSTLPSIRTEVFFEPRI